MKPRDEADVIDSFMNWRKERSDFFIFPVFPVCLRCLYFRTNACQLLPESLIHCDFHSESSCRSCSSPSRGPGSGLNSTHPVTIPVFSSARIKRSNQQQRLTHHHQNWEDVSKGWACGSADYRQIKSSSPFSFFHCSSNCQSCSFLLHHHHQKTKPHLDLRPLWVKIRSRYFHID